MFSQGFITIGATRRTGLSSRIGLSGRELPIPSTSSIPGTAPWSKASEPHFARSTENRSRSSLAKSLAVIGTLVTGGVATSPADAHHFSDHWELEETASVSPAVIQADISPDFPNFTQVANGPAVNSIQPRPVHANVGIPDRTELIDPAQLLELVERGQIERGMVSAKESNRYLFTYAPTSTAPRRTLYLQRPASSEEDRNLIRTLQEKGIYITQQPSVDPVIQYSQPASRASSQGGMDPLLAGFLGLLGGAGITSLIMMNRNRRQMGGAQQRGLDGHNKIGQVEVERPTTRLTDVRGHDEILEEIADVVLRIKAMNWRKNRAAINELMAEGQKLDDERSKERGTFLEQTARADGRWYLYDRRKKDLQRKIDEVKGALTESEINELDTITDLMDKLNGKIPKGVVFYGPPGTGKTLLARAIAGEADANFFKAAGSEFVEMFVGTGAARVRDLFSQAKAKAKETGKPSIIFIDEIDAVGGARGNGANSNQEREQTLNQLLTEMDGFDKNDNIMLIFATNRLDMLDSALIRPGRIDLQIQVTKPDKKGRQEILELYLKDKPLAPDVNIENIAGMTRGFAGADLENLVQLATDQAVRGKSFVITPRHLSDAFERVLLGVPKKRLSTWKSTKQKVAAHELGHGLAALACQIDIFVMSMVSRDKSLGHVIKDPESRDEFMLDRQEILEDVLISAAGRAAERALFGEYRATTGAAGDQENIERLYRMLRTTRLLDDGKRSDYKDPNRPLAPDDEKVLSQIISEAERVGMELIRMVPKAQYQQMIDDSLVAGTLIRDEANRFFKDHLQGYDWDKAYKLVEGFVKNPTGQNENVTGVGRSRMGRRRVPFVSPPPPTGTGPITKPPAEG